MKSAPSISHSDDSSANAASVSPDRVRAEFLHAWNGYKQYAWGHDALKPLSKTYSDWYPTPLLMTPVDAFDTMILMGLTGWWLVKDSHVGGRIDSYYEYLLKGAILFDDPELWAMWQDTIAAVNAHVADEASGGLWYGHVNINTGQQRATVFGALYAFFPAVLALGGDLDRAARLEDSCYKMWTLHGIAPECSTTKP